MPRTPHRGPGPPASERTPLTAWGSGAATCPGGAGSCASLPLGARHPPHLMWMVRRALSPRHAGQPLSGLTVHRVLPKVHSAAACAAPAQSPSAALNGYDGTTLFHHAAYAASYTTRVATWQATPLATSGIVPDKTAPGHAERGTPGAGKGIQERDLLCLRHHNV